MKRIRNMLINTLLILVSISIFDIAFEGIFLKMYIFKLPVGYHYILPRPYKALALHCKKDVIPSDKYTLLLGDSYAQGLGDWFLSTDFTKNEPFGSADVIYEKSGIDVLNFGKSGYSTISALSAASRSSYEYLNSSFFIDIKKPANVVAYFYEGNDLTDNIQVLNKLKDGDLTAEKLSSYSVYKNDVVDKVLNRNFYYFKGKYLFFIPQYLSFKVAESALSSFKKAKHTSEEGGGVKTGTINKVLIKGKVTDIPDNLQGPALELSGEELDKALAVTSSAFHDLKVQFPDSKIILMYLPSPLTTYDTVGDKVSTQSYFNRETTYDTEFMKQRADYVEKHIRQYALTEGFVFYNIRGDLRNMNAIIHGPRDWHHYNKAGYTVLGEKAAELLK